MPAVRPRTRIALATLILLSLSGLLYVNTEVKNVAFLRKLFPPSLQSGSDSFQDSKILRSFNLTPSFDYRRHCISAKADKGVVRQSLTNVSWPILSRSTLIHLGMLAQVNKDLVNIPHCDKFLPLAVPHYTFPSQGSTETLLLGVATPLERVHSSLPEMSRWLANTDTRLIVLLRDKPGDEKIQLVQDEAFALKMKVTILPSYLSEEREAESNFGLAKALYTNRGPDTRWFGVIDDDTFFLSLSKLLDALTPYDTRLPWYIGGLTERHLGISTEGFKAWGGAGIFFSLPLLEQLAKHSKECLAIGGTWGDSLWKSCLVRITSPTVKLTILPGLNQLDMFESVAGWYESGPYPLLSLHHWKSWHHFPVPVAHLVSDVSGVDTFLQRYRSADDLILTNGYSITQYPQGIPDLGLVEGTMFPYPGSSMPQDGGEFHDSLGALRPALKQGIEKISWNFVHAVKSKDGSVRQFYIKRAANDGFQRDGEGDEIDSVIEINWSKA